MKQYIINALLGGGVIGDDEVAHKFGVSKKDIQGEMKRLASEGIETEKNASGEYILKNLTDKINKDIIEYYTNGSMWNVETKQIVDSTNTYLKQKNGLKNGDVIIAETQTAGRGRRGRTWFSPKGNIYISMCVRCDSNIEKAPLTGLAAAVAAAKAIFKFGTDCKIKWPNDIVINGQKVCGILSEIAGDDERGVFCIVGIGINTGVSEFGEKVINPAVSLCEVCKREIDKNKLTAELLIEFEKQIKNKNMIDEYKKYCVNIGRTVKIIALDGEYTAEAIDINEYGNLIVKSEKGIAAVRSGEVSVRGIYGYCD